MKTLYRSAIGEVRTYEEWDKESAKLHKLLDSDADHPCPRPADWFERWTKILKLEELPGGMFS